MKKPNSWWRDGVFHIELPYCIVNLRPGLTDAAGREMDHIEIIPNNYPLVPIKLEPNVRNIKVYKREK